MFTKSRYWTLRFDGTEFQLESGGVRSKVKRGKRVLEENLETILFLWGNELLPAPQLHMLAHSKTLVPEQDLLAVDELGRIHIFELKRDSATAESLFQLISYLAARVQGDDEWLRKAVVDTVWYGELSMACRLAGLVARERMETLETEKSRRQTRKRVDHKELLQARLEEAAQIANKRTGFELSPKAFRRLSVPYLDRLFGEGWQGPLEDPAGVLDRIVETQMRPFWRLGRTRPRIVIWVVAPSVKSALEAARPLMGRNLEIRCVSVDVREEIPGREWNIAVRMPQEHVQSWARADAFATLLRQVEIGFLRQHPEAAARQYLEFPSASLSWTEKTRWTDLGWRVAGSARVRWGIQGDQIKLDLYHHGWTQGQALKIYEPLRRLRRRLCETHPDSWSWDPHDLEAACNRQFVEEAVQVTCDYWRGLQEIGAFDISEWGYWMPVDQN